MKRISILWLFVLCCHVLAIGQNITLTGKVIDENQEVIPFANVILMSAQDTTKILQGTSTNLQGVFTIKKIE